MNKWSINSVDVASAFLQGNEIKRDVFLKPPKEICPKDHVWKLKRCIYGLNDAPREWYNKVVEEFIKSGAVKSVLDTAMFMWYNKDDELVGHLVTHVDDFIYVGDTQWNKNVMDKIKDKFNISSEFEGSFKYIGLNVVQSNEMISIDQMHYIENINEIDLGRERKKLIRDILTPEERSKLKSLSGKMLWVTSQTRPDIAFATCMMCNAGPEATVNDILEANKAVRKMKNSNDVKINYRKLGNMKDVKLIVYADASHANLNDGSSQGAFIVFLQGNGKVSPLLWQSKKLKRITKSPLASETLAFGEGADAGILMSNVIQEVCRLKNKPEVICYTDGKSLKTHLGTSNTVEDMSLRTNMARLRQMIEMKEICAEWVPGKNQLADCLTKKTASSDHLLGVLATGILKNDGH